MSRTLIRRRAIFVAVFVLFILAILIAGCASTLHAPTSTKAIPVATRVSCTPPSSPSALVTVNSKEVCPSTNAGLQRGGYDYLLYIYQGGTIHIVTKGGSDQLTLIAVAYQVTESNGASRTVTVYEKALSYDVGIVQASCRGMDITAQPLAVDVYVPDSSQTDPTVLGRIDSEAVAALDPSFGLPPQRTFSEVADALCAEAAS